MTTYSMKVDGESVYLKNGVPRAKWGLAVIDENTGKLYPSPQKAAEACGVSGDMVRKVAKRDYKPTDKVNVRKATTKEVMDVYLSSLRDIVEVKKREKRKPTWTAAPKSDEGLCYRELADGRVEIKAAADKNWSMPVADKRRVYRSVREAAEFTGDLASAIKYRVMHGNDGWSWATADEVHAAWPKAVRAYTTPTPTAALVPTASFMAVTWPDGQVTVRATTGPWSRHFAAAADVPSDIMAAAKSYQLGGGE